MASRGGPGRPEQGDPTVEGNDHRAPVHAGVSAGSMLGRYRIVRRLGAGGMGVVYEAHDTELDRRVALKVLRHPARGDGSYAREQRARLVREAQSLARVSHAHVVSVFDAGTSGDDVFVAMELVDGDNVAAWLAAGRRDWRAIVDVFIQAGRGLAAAHVAGLVHRDFKPGNVIVGSDGRVRVCDFGLARIVHAPPVPRDPMTVDARGTVEESRLTEDGAVLGTPMYMAPEQHVGEDVDARGDQYSFCASLWEALAGGTPFPDCTTPEQVLAAATEGRLRPISNARVTRRLRRVMLRGLSIDPADRFADMAALVDELVSIRRLPRRLAIAAGAIALVGASAGIAVAVTSRGDHAPELPPCTARLDGVWDAAVKESIAKAFRAVHWPGAPATLVDATGRLEAYAGRWKAMRIEACETMRLGEQSAELFDLRVACLDRRRDELAALTSLFTRADEGVALKAVPAILELTTIDGCADAVALRRAIPLPRDPALRAKIDALRGRVDQAIALRRAGRYGEGVEVARGAAAEIDGVAYAPVRAEVLTALGELEDYSGGATAAEAAYRRAATAAGEANDDHLLANAWASLVYVVGISLGRMDDALQIGEFAATVVARAKEPASAGTLHNNLGAIHLVRRELEIASAEFERAIVDRTAAFGDQHPAVARSMANLGSVRARQKRFADADKLLHDALAIQRRTLAPEHPEIAAELSNLGLVASKTNARTAIELEREALALRERAQLGGAEIGRCLSNIGGYEVQLHLDADAERDYRAAIVRFREALPAKHPNLGVALTGLAEALDNLHRPAEAVAIAEEGYAIASANPSDAINLADAKYSLGVALHDSGKDRARGRKLVEEARDLYGANDNLGWQGVAAEWLTRTAAP